MHQAGNTEACESWDVAIVGGALSGASAALILKQKAPSLRIVLIEKNASFKRRVGEATVEVSGYFLCRILGLTSFLTQTQLCKNGLRFWFANAQSRNLGNCSEIGGKYLSTVPSFLIDRSVLDEEVLSRATALGVNVIRPALVKSVELSEGGEQTLFLQTENDVNTLKARWVIDASGVRCLLARKNNWFQPNQCHPTLAAWTRWKGVKDWDDTCLSKTYSELSKNYVGIRGTATNHIIGDGWWAWWIALKGGDTSIGIVIDQRRVTWPGGDEPLGEKIRKFLSSHPVAHEMMMGAEFIDGDINFRRNLSYSSKVQSGDGFALTGDALAFIDPFYSPGMDWIAFSTLAAVNLVMAWRNGEDIRSLSQKLNNQFAISYQRMFEALYLNKYDYMGDYEIMRLGFRLDIAFYYLFIAYFVFRDGEEGFKEIPFTSPQAAPIFALMRLYNKRFASIARKRRETGRFGRFNSGRRDFFPGFNFKRSMLAKIILKSLLAWAILEIKEGWKSWIIFHPNSSEEVRLETSQA
jgi:flavin-dependent dehydrogenase